LDEVVIIKIRHEISRIDKSLKEVSPLLNLCKIKEQPDIIEITATAQVLHSFYNGIESIIVLIFKYMNEKIPNDFRWHKTLLEMAFGANSKNVQILNKDLKDKMEEYLSFRHFIRHSYSSELDWKVMGPLVKEIENIWIKIKIDFGRFVEKIENEQR